MSEFGLGTVHMPTDQAYAPDAATAERAKNAALSNLNRRYAYVRNISGVIELETHEIYRISDFHTLEVEKTWVPNVAPVAPSP